MKSKYLVLAGGVAIVIGSLLPWTTKTITIPALGEVPAAIFRWNETGTDNLAGWFTLGLGLMVIIFSLTSIRIPGKFHNVLTGVLGLLAGIFTIIGLSFMTDMSHYNHQDGYADVTTTVSIGIGLFVLIVGILAVLFGSFTRNPDTNLAEVTTALAR
jgi:hypothetical protein